MPDTSDAPGRDCPLHYRYPASVFDRAPDLRADVLYVVGGLYGNLEAWQALQGLLDAERAARHGEVAVVLNGDFHWFDAEPAWFDAIERATAGQRRLRGNVETELADPAPGAGCGCAYPGEVSDALVERSNRILEQLRAAAAPAARTALGRLPMHAVARVGDTRWGLVHGDAESLAGWGFDAGTLDAPGRRPWLDACLRDAGVDGFASSHTCSPALRAFDVDGRERLVVNNGAAGMPNIEGRLAGLVTRIALAPPPRPALYGRAWRGLQVHAMPLDYDAAAFERRFLARWAPGSDAHASYFERIRRGPAFRIAQALGLRAMPA